MNQNKYIKAFVAGSAFPVILSPMLYMGIPYSLQPGIDFNYFAHVLVIPVLIGLINILFIKVKHYLPAGTTKYWVWGAGHGFIFSLLGNFYSHIPTELFKIERPAAFITIAIATVLYACIWRFIIRNINVMMNID